MSHDETTARPDREQEPKDAEHPEVGPEMAPLSSVSTADPEVAAGPEEQSGWRADPTQSVSAATGAIGEAPPHPPVPAPEPAPKAEAHANPKGGPPPADRDLAAREHAPARPPSTFRIAAISGVVALICGVAGAWGFTSLAGGAKPSADEKSSKKDDSDKGSGKGGEQGSGDSKGGSGPQADAKAATPAGPHAGDESVLAKQFEQLSARVNLLDQRLKSPPTTAPQPSPAMSALENTVAELARSMGDVVGMPGRVRDESRRIDKLQHDLDEMKSKGVTTVVNPPPAAGVTPMAAPPLDDATLKLGVGLFNEARYAEAYDVFKRLQKSTPLDARAWYYSALSIGLTTRDWEGEAKQFVEKGLERERVGTPTSREVNETFRELTVVQGKDWLAAYRRRLSE